MPTKSSGPKELQTVAEQTDLDPVLPDGVLSVELVPGVMLKVLPPRMWRLSAYRALRQGDIDLWAEKCMATQADAQILMDTDPTTEQFTKFSERVNEAAEAGGK